jgi:hypothetical protein
MRLRWSGQRRRWVVVMRMPAEVLAVDALGIGDLRHVVASATDSLNGGRVTNETQHIRRPAPGWPPGLV